MKNFMILYFLAISSLATGQVTEEQAVINTIKTMFDAMRESDSSKLVSVIYEGATLKTFYQDKTGQPRIHEGSMDAFASSLAKPHEEVYDEKIWNYEVEIDGLLATAWTEYTFFLDDAMSHCGVNAFQLFRAAEGWRIVSITDTRRKEGCQTTASMADQQIHQLMDNWHRAAAEADEEIFFGSMSEDAIYLGTDASERWLRDELKTWSQKYFERDSAWSFTAKDRQIYFSNDNKTAWMEELLDTWMGPCRGSAVLEYSPENGWKIKHYNLAVLVPNDAIQDYIKIIEEK